LAARNEGRLSSVLNSKQLTLYQWDWFLERCSKPPFRSEGNHQQNLNALKFLRPVFGDVPLSDLTAEAIEDYVANGLWDERKVPTKFGIQLRGAIKPATVHQEFRLLSQILNEIHSQAALHDSHRTGHDRVCSTQLPVECRCDPVGDGASI